MITNDLLTGGTGYIGSHIAMVLIVACHEVVLYYNLSNSDIHINGRSEKITNKYIT